MCIKIYVFIQHCIRKITAAPLYKLNLWHPIEYIVVEIHYITIEIFRKTLIFARCRVL